MAVIEYTHGISGRTDLLMGLRALGSSVVVVDGLVLEEDLPNRPGTYLTETDGLENVHQVLVSDTGGNHRGDAYVFMTDTDNLHICVSYPNVADRLGTMRVDPTGIVVVVPDVYVTVLASAPALETIDEGGKLTFHRGDYISFSLTLGTVTGRTGEKLHFTIKRDKEDTDADAVFQMTELSGALVIDGEESEVPTDASMTVQNEETGQTLFIIKSDLSELLPAEAELWYDVQMTNAAGERVTLTEGRADITADVTRSPLVVP